jgi:hypothetical protein
MVGCPTAEPTLGYDGQCVCVGGAWWVWPLHPCRKDATGRSDARRDKANPTATVDAAGRPLGVARSAATGTRRGVGTDLPIGKDPPGMPCTTQSDIDYLAPPSSHPYFEGQSLPSVGPEGLIPSLPAPSTKRSPSARTKPLAPAGSAFRKRRSRGVALSSACGITNGNQPGSPGLVKRATSSGSFLYSAGGGAAVAENTERREMKPQRSAESRRGEQMRLEFGQTGVSASR